MMTLALSSAVLISLHIKEAKYFQQESLWSVFFVLLPWIAIKLPTPRRPQCHEGDATRAQGTDLNFAAKPAGCRSGGLLWPTRPSDG